MGRGSGDEILSVGLKGDGVGSVHEVLKNISHEESCDARLGAEALRMGRLLGRGRQFGILKQLEKVELPYQYHVRKVFPEDNELEMRAKALLFMFEELKNPELKNPDHLNDPDEDHSGAAFPIYPFPVTVAEDGSVVDPDGNVIDHLSPETTPNLLLALHANQDRLGMGDFMLDNDKPGQTYFKRNQILDAAYRESQFYDLNNLSAFIDDSSEEVSIRATDLEDVEIRRLTDRDGNTVFMRKINENPQLLGAVGSVTSKEYAEQLVDGIARGADNNDLSGMYLARCDFKGRDFQGVQMTDVRAELSDFTGARFIDASISGYLDGSTWEAAIIKESDISNADLSDTEARSIQIDQSDIYNTKLDNADLSSAQISRSNLSRVNMDHTNLFAAQITDSSIKGSLNGANTGWSSFERVDASEIEARGFGGELIHVKDSNFSKSRMPGASFTTLEDRSDLRIENSNFEDTVMSGSTFRGNYDGDGDSETYQPLAKDSNFDGSKQENSSYSNCVLEGCTYRDVQFQGSEMKNVIFRGCDFKGASFSGVDVSGVEFLDTENLDLAGAINADQAVVRRTSETIPPGAFDEAAKKFDEIADNNIPRSASRTSKTIRGGDDRAGRDRGAFDEAAKKFDEIADKNIPRSAAPDDKNSVPDDSPTGAMGRMKEGQITPFLKNKEKVSQERSESSSPTGAMGRMKEGQITPFLKNKEKVSQERSEATSKLSSMHGSALKKTAKKRASKKDRIAALRAIHQRNPDASNAEIAEEMGVSSARVSQLRKEAGIPGKRGRPKKS